MREKTFLQYYLPFFLILISPIFSSCEKGKTKLTTEENQTDKLVLTAFLNNDKFEDTIIVKPIAKDEKFNNFIIVNPWDTLKVSGNGEPLSLRVKFGGQQKEFLLHDSSYFATPMWSSDSLPIRILKKDKDEFIDWKSKIPELDSDAILLGTEAGIDILLFWNGYKFNLFWPDEEP